MHFRLFPPAGGTQAGGKKWRVFDKILPEFFIDRTRFPVKLPIRFYDFKYQQKIK
jgi:hypothetical protein